MNRDDFMNMAMNDLRGFNKTHESVTKPDSLVDAACSDLINNKNISHMTNKDELINKFFESVDVKNNISTNNEIIKQKTHESIFKSADDEVKDRLKKILKSL